MRGHVRKRGNKWAVVVYLGYDEQGKKRYKWHGGFKTKREAERFLASIAEDVHDKTYVVPSKMPFRELFEAFLEFKRSKVKESTIRQYRWYVEQYAMADIGHIPICDLKPTHFVRLYNRLRDEHGLTPNTLLIVHIACKQAMKAAVKWGYLARNVMDAVDAPTPKRPKLQVWDEKQLRTFLSVAMEHQYGIAFLLLATTGMRVGEVLALRWRDVDLENGVIHVTQSVTRVQNKLLVSSPKNAASNRAIAITADVVDALRRHKRAQNEVRLLMGQAWQDNDLVVCRVDGSYALRETLDAAFKRIIKRLGLPRIRLHDLRHAHATILLKLGVHPKVVQERLGHSNISTTLNTYSHVLPGLQEAAASAFSDLLRLDNVVSDNED
ncbi:tyrosine-type recombinase/integrase [Alicyclobacillus sendaiensis]|uniref:site-specific integrase n=1 Tax=Alicyclobacillus sendaiensis TaxID=192387 RepID=UPI0026F45812|nr:tyrosine-type recombinase/integrase [Alicyclobacillus sendaiensis]